MPGSNERRAKSQQRLTARFLYDGRKQKAARVVVDEVRAGRELDWLRQDRFDPVPLRRQKARTSRASLACPDPIISKSLTRIAARLSLIVAGTESGKNETTLSSSRSKPASAANPIAVEVKLLLSE